jgi:arsenite-transporting ATPase
VTRVLLFTGKGGVGKTTAAAATAVRCADDGLRTVVLSTDPAHSLADAFDVPLGPIATPVTERLWGQQLDAQERMEESWHDIQGYLREVFSWAGVDGLEAEELSVIPGLDEIFALSDIKSFAESGDWDVVVVDCASCRSPTSSTGTWSGCSRWAGA